MMPRKVVFYSIKQRDAKAKRQNPAQYLLIIIVLAILFGISVLLELWQSPVAILISAL